MMKYNIEPKPEEFVISIKLPIREEVQIHGPLYTGCDKAE